MKEMDALFEALTGKTPQQAAVDGEELRRHRAATEEAELRRRAAKRETLVPADWDRLASVTPRQAAAILDVNKRTILNWVKEGRLEKNERGRILTASIQGL